MPRIFHCRSCSSSNLKQFFDLGSQPLANALLPNPNSRESAYPLALVYCADCTLVQLDYTVSPKLLFSDYVWVTGTSDVAQKYADIFRDGLVERTPYIKEGYVAEIASNDGTFLKPFLRSGIKAIGIDPAENIVKIAESDGVPTICKFFSSKVARDVVGQYGKAEAVFARNVLPHVADPRDFIRGISIMLSNTGTAAIEVHYAKIIQEELHYDSIYHEHLCYFSLMSLGELLNDFGLKVFSISSSPISGGSLVFYVSKDESRLAQDLSIYSVPEIERNTNSFSSWNKFAEKSFNHRKELLALIGEYAGRNIVGYGASARSSTLLNFCGIDSSIVSVMADKNSLKHGKYTPGTHIPISNPLKVKWDSVDLVFVTGWNFADEIMDDLLVMGYRGDCLLPLPGEPTIVSV